MIFNTFNHCFLIPSYFHMTLLKTPCIIDKYRQNKSSHSQSVKFDGTLIKVI